jgi:hypothetical protein
MRGECARHPHKVYCSNDPSSTYYADHQGYTYRVECYKLNETARWELTALVRDESDRHKNVFIWKPVIALDFLPSHITPDNINQKLPTLLVFS